MLLININIDGYVGTKYFITFIKFQIILQS